MVGVGVVVVVAVVVAVVVGVGVAVGVAVGVVVAVGVAVGVGVAVVVAVVVVVEGDMTDPRTLADRLEDWPFGSPAFSKSECLEAAALLRHLDALLDAIGDPDRLLVWAYFYRHRGATLPEWLRRIADAVDGPTPTNQQRRTP